MPRTRKYVEINSAAGMSLGDDFGMTVRPSSFPNNPRMFASVDCISTEEISSDFFDDYCEVFGIHTNKLFLTDT